MPRRPTKRHVLRNLREVIGITQRELAEMAGVKPISINRIENGSLAISSDLARRINVSTGLNLREIAQGPTGKLLDHFGRPYTKESFGWWRTRGAPVNPGDAEALAANLAWWMGVLLQAASRSRGGRGYRGVAAALIQTMNTVADDFGLSSMIDTILKDCEPRVKWTPGSRTPGELKEIAEETEREMRPDDPIARQNAFMKWEMERSVPSPQMGRMSAT
jgi:transcriptional regulator with XRE-family HTH domain